MKKISIISIFLFCTPSYSSDYSPVGVTCDSLQTRIFIDAPERQNSFSGSDLERAYVDYVQRETKEMALVANASDCQWSSGGELSNSARATGDSHWVTTCAGTISCQHSVLGNYSVGPLEFTVSSPRTGMGQIRTDESQRLQNACIDAKNVLLIYIARLNDEAKRFTCRRTEDNRNGGSNGTVR